MPINNKSKRANFRRNQLVVKSNDLIQKARYNLSLEEQRIVCYLISHIDTTNTFLHEIPFSILDYCSACGIVWDGGKTYSYIREALKSLRDKSFWVSLGNGYEQTVAWFSYVKISENDGTAIVKFDEMMIPYLLLLRERFTQYQLRNILAMRSKYSVRLYELLKSYENLHEPIDFEIDRLRILMDAQHYIKYTDLRRFVLDPAVREIMDYTDINVSYTTEKIGRAVARIIFRVHLKNSNETILVRTNQEMRLEPNYNPDQLHLENF